ncbi:MAG: creatininase family protein, partial [Polyangiales bacterium]
HLPLHNDRLISAGLARDLHARLAVSHPEWPFLAADNLAIGVEPTPGLGTRHTPYLRACALVREACRAIAELGARRVILMTFHGAPLHGMALDAGVDLLATLGIPAVSPLNLITQAMLADDGAPYAEAFAHVEDEAERAAMIRDLPRDFHAGFFETSMTLHYNPASVSPSYVDLPPCAPIQPIATFSRLSRLASLGGATDLAKELEFVAHALGWHALRPFPGYTGRPHRATATAGAFFARTILDRYVTLVEDVFAGRARSPRPILLWTEKLTLSGRLAAVRA